MNLGFRADVNSLCRLIQDQNGWIRGEPAAQRNFLLITARKSTHGCVQRRSLDSESAKVFAGNTSLHCKIDRSTMREPCENCERHVRGNRQVRDHSVPAAIF